MNVRKFFLLVVSIGCFVALLGGVAASSAAPSAAGNDEVVLARETAVGASALPDSAQNNDLWQDSDAPSGINGPKRLIVPRAYRLVQLDVAQLSALLPQAPMERSGKTPVTMVLPLPDGTFGRFALVESPVMEPALAAKFPDIKTYSGQGIDDKSATVRLDWTRHGFHAMIMSSYQDTVYIDPYQQGNVTHYMSYWRDDYEPLSVNAEAIRHSPLDPKGVDAVIHALVEAGAAPTGDELRTYRAAVAATGEYTQFHGGTVPDGMAAIVVAMNRVNQIYERELSIHMNLVANNDSLIFTDPGSDPYTNDNGGTMLGENQTTVDSIIGQANYDIGHVFSTGGGGVAYLGSVCDPPPNSLKAGGVTGLGAPIGDPFYVDYVSHEMGHQFGANHTFNSTTGACGGGNRNDSTAYEPGSASTIMGYAGICGADDLQSNSDDYFHTISFDEMIAFSQSGGGNSCAAITNTGNNVPVPNAGTGGFTIPSGTPFELIGSATDGDGGDVLSYNWEQFDLDPGTGGSPSSTTPPYFRSWSATATPNRVIPRLTDLLNNTMPFGETYPTVDDTLTFRMTVRDNQAGAGGVDYDTLSFDVDSGSGPFLVTVPNTAVTWLTSSSETVTWNVAGTAAAPVSCANVDILLSYDGGYTYPATLVSGTPNDGTQAITVPTTQTLTARVKVVCSDNIFFDISNEDFYILASGPQVLTSPASLSSSGQAPDTTVNQTFTINNIGDSSLTWSLAEDVDADCLSPADIGWVSSAPTSGSVPASGSTNVTVTFDTTGLGIGTYEGNLCLTSNDVDTGDQLIIVPLTLNVEVISCTTYNSSDTPIAISASGAPLISSAITATGSDPIFDINVTLQATHSWVNDLDFNLQSPQGTTIEVLSQTCGDQDNLSLVLDDESVRATGSWPCPPTDGLDYQPSNALSGYDDEAPAGTWTMFVQDHVDQDGGSFDSWSLEICTRQPAAVPGRHIETTPASVSNTQAPNTTSNHDVTISNVGDTTLTWSVTEDDSSDCASPTSVGWLSAAPTSGSTPGSFASDIVDLTLDSTGLGDGSYTAYICISNDDDDPADQLQIVPVTLMVETVVCTTYTSLDTGQGIPPAGNSGTTNSIINVIGGGSNILDVNVLNLAGTHGRMGQLNFTLDSPGASGAQQILDPSACGNTDNFDLNIDEAAAPGAPPCPPTGGGTYRSNGTGNLAAYNGEDSNGTWTLSIIDGAGAGGGDGTGTLNSWQLEICTGPPLEPNLELSPTSLSSSQLPDTTVASGFVISNTGTGVLTWTNVRTDTDNNCATTEAVSWVTGLTPTSGTTAPGTADSVSFNFDTAGMDPGSYSANLCVDSDDSGSPAMLPLDLTVETPVWPILSMPIGVTATAGVSVMVPVDFISNGYNITSVAFSIDFDESCLAFNDTDADANGVPDAITFSVSGVFGLKSASYDGADTDGEIDILIADISPPLSSLPDSTLVTIGFTPICTPAGSDIVAPVVFSNDPSASYGDTSGGSVDGGTEDGSVLIQENACAAPAASPAIMSALNGAMVDLSWVAVGDADQYEIWWGVNDPYFTLGADCGVAANCAIDTLSPYSSGNGVGDTANNYSYVLRAANSCGATAADMSNRTGEFDFGVVPGA